LILVGLGVAAAGALIGETVGYAIAGVGLFISLLSAIFLGKSKKSKETLALARKFNGCECSSLNAIIEELEEKLAKYEELEKKKADKLSDLRDEETELKLGVCEYLGRFPVITANTVREAVQILRDRFSRYCALAEAGEMNASGKIEKLKRSEELLASVGVFLARFPTESSSPFAEIRDRISDYSHLITSVAQKERECDVFAVRHGVTGKTVTADANAEAVIHATLADIQTRIKEISSEYTLVNRELEIARAEIDKKDEYTMAKEELEELYAKHVESLEIIKKTAALLGEACDNITSKYLGKTKAKFEEYSSLIAGDSGEYTLSTSFELTKTERGEAHGIESYSRGTRDLYALSLRLALVDALYEKQTPFIILDDPFIALDDARLERAKETLKALGKSKQILYFTCAKSRAIE
jgi:DNA repair exonuclease SbcCD ATPase subunit